MPKPKGLPGILGVLFLSIALMTGCNDGEAPGGGGFEMPPPAVDILSVKTRAHTPESEFPGRVAPVRSAQIRARVPGIILSRNFEEGADVKKGDLLFQIDPAPFEARLSKAQANLAASEASLFDARTVIRRYEKLVKTGAISTQQFKTAQASKRMAQAEIRTAKLDLEYAAVRAPISGRIGRALVTEGALVGQGEATILAVVQQLDPIYVDFNEPVSQYLKLKSAFSPGADGSGNPARVDLILDDINYTQEGRFLFSDVTVDQQTGQVPLRSEFSNEKGLLLPGMFVRVRATLKTIPDAIFIPQRAVLRNADGSARVMVVDEKGAAQPRPVKMGTMEGDQWQVLEGLAPGEKIVTTGANKVKPGMILNPEK